MLFGSLADNSIEERNLNREEIKMSDFYRNAKATPGFYQNLNELPSMGLNVAECRLHGRDAIVVMDDAGNHVAEYCWVGDEDGEPKLEMMVTHTDALRALLFDAVLRSGDSL